MPPPEKRVVQEVVPGVFGSFTEEEAGLRSAAIGATDDPTVEAELGARRREALQKEAFNTPGDKALAVVDGVIKGLSGGIAEGLPVGDSFLEAEARTMRGQVHSGAKTFAELAAIAGTVLSPKSALRLTPLGAANVLQTRVAAGTSRALRAKEGTRAGVLTGAVGEAAGGAAAAGLLSSGQQISNAINAKPVSGGAVVDDIGLGTMLGGGLGVVGGAFGRQAAKIKDAKAEVAAAGRFDEMATQTRAYLEEGVGAWDITHKEATRRLSALNDLEKAGGLDADLLGAEWLATRREAAKAADKARNSLLKATGTRDISQATQRAADLLVTGTPRQVEKVASALQDYNQSLSHFDLVMRPTDLDRAHLLSVSALDDLDTVMAASDHPLNRMGRMIEEGADDASLRAFAEANDLGKISVAEVEASARVPGRFTGAQGPAARRRLSPEQAPAGPVTGAQGPAALRGRGRADELVPVPQVEDDLLRQLEATRARVEAGLPITGPPTRRLNVRDPRAPTKELPGRRRQEITGTEPTIKAEVPVDALADFVVPPKPQAGPVTSVFKRLPTTQQVAGLRGKAAFKAHQILNEASFAANPLPASQVGDNIRGAIDRFSSSTGGRLGSDEARLLANKLGVNTAAVADPFAQRYVEAWALGRLSSEMGNEASSFGKAVRGRGRGAVRDAIRAGAVTGVRSGVRSSAGAFVGGAAGSLTGAAVGHVLGAAGVLAATAGRLRQAAVLGVAKATSPVGRRVAVLTAVVARPFSYDGSEPTTNFEAKAAQLRELAGAPDAVRERMAGNMTEVRLIDPAAADAAVEAAQTRLKNLAARLPPGTSRGAFAPPGPPTQDEIDDFQMYEAATWDRSLVFTYIRAGSMPEAIASAMREQHPDFMDEIRQYVLDNPEAMERAPYNAQIAMSTLLDVPLIPEADPLYVVRQQQAYLDAREKDAQAQASQQGASIMRGGMPAPPPATPAQQFATLPSIR